MANYTGFHFINKSAASLPEHHQSLTLANLEPYRLQKTERTLAFDDGVSFKLLSAAQLIEKGAELNLDGYPTVTSIDPRITLIFVLSEDGRLAIRSEIDSKSKLYRIGKGFPSQTPQIITKSEFEQMEESKRQIILDRPHQYKIE